jgi:hypothetical protein
MFSFRRTFVAIRFHKTGMLVSAVEQGVREIPLQDIKVRGESDDTISFWQEAVSALTKYLRDHGIRGGRATIILEPEWVYTHSVEIPKTGKAQEEFLLTEAIQTTIPENEDDIVRLTRSLGSKGDGTLIGVAAVRKDMLATCRGVVTDAGLSVECITLPAMVVAAASQAWSSTDTFVTVMPAVGNGSGSVTVFHKQWPIDEAVVRVPGDEMVAKDLISEYAGRGMAPQRVVLAGASVSEAAAGGEVTTEKIFPVPDAELPQAVLLAACKDHSTCLNFAEEKQSHRKIFIAVAAIVAVILLSGVAVWKFLAPTPPPPAPVISFPVESGPIERRGFLMVETEGREVVFTDVPFTAWFMPSVDTLVRKGIAQGYKDSVGNPTGEYGPERPVTYAEMLKMALAASGKEGTAGQTRNVSAVGTWAEPFVKRAEDDGFTVFTPTVDVNTGATRGAVVQTIVEAFGLPLTLTQATFTDVPVDHPNAAAISIAAQRGFISGDKDANGEPLHTFRPDAPINRAEATKMIAEALNSL